MKFLKFFLKFFLLVVFIFIIYIFVYHYTVNSRQGTVFGNTFLASESDLSKSAGEEAYIPLQTDNLSEDMIDREGFYVRIDKISLFKPIVKNVDPRSKDIYQTSWEIGVSHGMFTALPDEIGNVYLFAHAVSNEKFIDANNAWFTLLDQLSIGDEVIIYYEGTEYIYQVSRIYIVKPTDTSVYTGVSPVPKVTMQTCGPPRGSVDSRYMVEALQISVVAF